MNLGNIKGAKPTGTLSALANVTAVSPQEVTMPNQNQQQSRSNQGNNQNIQGNQRGENESEHTKKDGSLDHRYKGQREGAEEDRPNNENYTKAETGGSDATGRHVTKDGAPDRRFEENRDLSEEDAKVIQAENVIESAASNQNGSSNQRGSSKR